MKLLGIAALTITLLGTGSAWAEPKPFVAVEYRKGIFKAIKWNFGPMGAMVKGKIDYDAESFRRRAENLAALSKMPLEGFRPGTYDRATSALPAIEQDWETFTKGMAALEENTAALAEVAKGGDMKAIKPAFVKVARTCKGCHDQFKD